MICAWSRVGACALCRLKSETRVWIRGIRRDQSCNTDQTELQSNPVEGLGIKSDIVVNVDVFNRRLVTQLPKVELDYGVRCRFE